MKVVLLDSNLLVLLVIGVVNKRWIGRHKRSRAFEPSDWELLLDLINQRPVLTTPHILTEASNLLRSGGLKGEAEEQLMAALATFFDNAREEHVPARDVSTNVVYLRLGLADAVIHSLARPDIELLTADFDLYRAALHKGQPVTNFNHYRASTR